jgi:site-specific DNA recombinase
VSKRREGAGGRLAGGQHFSRGALYLMLQNRLYRGDIVHQGEAYPGVAGMTRKRGIFGAHGGVAGRQDGQFAAGAAER